MNRRNFFKTVTGFVAGVFVAPKAKAKDKLMCGGQNGTLCPRCKFNMDKILAVPKAKENLRDFDAHLVLGDDFDEVDLMVTKENPWDKLGCKDCFRGCGQWDICMATLRKRVEENDTKKEVPLKIFNGQVFEAPWPFCHTVIVQYFDLDKWILLSDPYRTQNCLSGYNGTAMMVCYYERKLDGGSNPFYTQAELQEKLKNWKLVKSRLILDERRCS